ncbi:ABC transporter ATP-binding protein [Peptoniphilus harei]|uniref:ABC transporter ATP-binding protein n=1 Tax=Peptoniphilus TaxID=162289 RepID=UPI00254F766D|nr:ABC transporter ATP-binding protein [Peptoniphilus harei]MDK7354487.1 ABC transporter ATP-binding protein [Peptoniphilus harei]MDK7369884.1 ABC transporter ATP-binding protein [Peptoniphilus harei]MDK7377987.1 ABC transporter ATP-binding protein [Peptoniphilus harei]MDK7680296.1 ABC transporter ATP-binding protein [Peptoniphilus harei]MDU5323620.1 ABC transporter ATP-binding protein [Peptoniphilus harei]
MLLEIKDLEVFFKSSQGIVKAVNKANINTRDGKTTAIVGESGSGKSVTSLAIMGLLDKSSIEKISGEINFEGKNLLKSSPEELRRIRGNEISMIFQEPMTSLNPALKVGYQMSEVFRTHFKMDKKTAKEKSIEMIKKVEIPRPEEVYNSYPHELSGGMRQRIMIAMALSSSPKLLIADEPTTALDVTIQKEVLELMKKLKEDMNTSIIFISHDLGVVSDIADYVNVMYAGKLVERAKAEDIFKRPLHPYTRGLIKAIPSAHKKKDELYTIRGSVPNPIGLPDCCNFCDRCDEKMKICEEKAPEEVDVDGQKVSCFLYR